MVCPSCQPWHDRPGKQKTNPSHAPTHLYITMFSRIHIVSYLSDLHVNNLPPSLFCRYATTFKIWNSVVTWQITQKGELHFSFLFKKKKIYFLARLFYITPSSSFSLNTRPLHIPSNTDLAGIALCATLLSRYIYHLRHSLDVLLFLLLTNKHQRMVHSCFSRRARERKRERIYISMSHIIYNYYRIR